MRIAEQNRVQQALVPCCAPRRRAESGYILLVLLLMVSLLLISLAATAPSVLQENKREKEEEMIHRGVQYARAIQHFYKKFGRYPTSLDQLKETNHIRFLRKAYADPMAKDGKWKLLHPGDVKIVGAANIGTPVSALAANTAQPGQLGAQTGSTFGQSSAFNNSAFNNSPLGMTQANPATGTAAASTGPVGLSSRPSSSTDSTTPSTSMTSGAGPMVIGAPIIGVTSTNNAEGIHEFDGKPKYSEWYFIYDPTTDRGGLITGPYTGKIFANAPLLPGATPAGGINGAKPVGTSGFGQPMGSGLGGQPMNPGGLGQPTGTPPPHP